MHPPKRYYDLDALRCRGNVIGVALHGLLFLTANHFFPWPVHLGPVLESAERVVLVIHIFRMPLFFFFSRFFSSYICQRFSVYYYLQHRFKRIVIPLLIGLIVMSPFHFFEFKVAHKTAYWVSENLWLNYIGFTGTLWFLYYLMIYSVLNIILFLIFQHSNPRVLGWYWLFLIFLFILYSLFFQDGHIIPSFTFNLDMASFSYYFLFFGMGSLFFFKRLFLGFRNFIWLGIIFLISSMVYIFLFFNYFTLNLSKNVILAFFKYNSCSVCYLFLLVYMSYLFK